MRSPCTRQLRRSVLTRIRSFGEIVGYLERQYDDILAEESRIKRNPRFRDNRVHVLLYFVQPTGKSIPGMKHYNQTLTISRPRSS